MLRLHDTLTREQRPVEPAADDGVFRFYVCGPTIHDHAHVGNWRTFTFQDVLKRVLLARGLRVRHVINITDVEDKIIRRAGEAGIDVSDPSRLPEYTQPFLDAFQEDREALRILPADEFPKATEHVAGMIDLVAKLVERGHAYVSDGSVYYAVDSFPDYGRLARIDADSMQVGARVEADEYEKDDVRDFVLWKAWKEGEPRWESPWGPGRPGWHLECSVMSLACLGSETIDLHAGGEDLVFPHHTNEIAQSEGATGKLFSRAWVHCAHLRVDGQKMSKSLGNFYTLRDLVAKGHDPIAVRYLLASVHYRAPVNLTDEALEAAAKAVARIREFARRLAAARPAATGPDAGTTADHVDLADRVAAARVAFNAALDDDLNTSEALGVLFGVVREVNPAIESGTLDEAALEATRKILAEADAIFAVLPERGLEPRTLTREVAGKPYEVTATEDVPVEILEKVVARQQARKDRDFETADRLRDELSAAGYVVDDVPGGARVKQA